MFFLNSSIFDVNTPNRTSGTGEQASVDTGQASLRVVWTFREIGISHSRSRSLNSVLTNHVFRRLKLKFQTVTYIASSGMIQSSNSIGMLKSTLAPFIFIDLEF